MDYLEIWLLEDLTDDELARGYEYLDNPTENLKKICTVDGCGRPLHSRDMCRIHYGRVTYATKKRPKPTKVTKACTIDDCEITAFCRGMCRHHYNQMYHAARTAKQRDQPHK